MSALYVTEQGARLGLDHRRLEIRKDGEVLDEVPLGHVERVVIVGNVGLTTPALKRLMHKGIDLVFVSMTGRYYGRVVGELTPHITLRRAQYRLQAKLDFRQALARRLVAGKLQSQLQLLQVRGEGVETTAHSALLADMQTYSAKAERAQTANALRGIEGSGSARYFGGLRSLLAPSWSFKRRNRRPPRDPINVLLSLGYTLLTRAVESAVYTVGLDPYVGFLHADAYNRPSLALDLVEEFRVWVDALILDVCREEIVTPADFRAGGFEEPPVVMERPAVKRYIAAYEKRLRSRQRHPRTGQRLARWRFLELQARELARCLQHASPDYRPWHTR
jgi:CRISPR-associated protein Cas1